MDTALTKSQVFPRWKQSRLVSVLAAYEDSVTAARGVEFCRNLVRLLGPECEITQQVWLFNEFRVFKLREIAAGEAAAADVVVISAHHSASVPDEVKDWMEMWLNSRSNSPAILAALLDPLPRGASSSMEAYLQERAQKAGMEFIFEIEDPRVDR
jgi:hypothetical protein